MGSCSTCVGTNQNSELDMGTGTRQKELST